MDSTWKIIRAIDGIILTLVLGEIFGGAISKPITAWRGNKVCASKLVTLIDVMNKRICDLEDKFKEQEKEPEAE